MAEAKQILLSIFLLCFLKNTAAKSIVKYSPGVEGPLPFELETGYINVGDGHYAYYFVKSYNNPATDPLLFSFAGGPGCASSAIFLFCGQGPLLLNMIPFNGSIPTLYVNPYSWTNVANIVYIDQPVGAGFSYSTDLEGGHSDDISSAKTSHVFIKKWLDDHQDFQSNPVYVIGDGYGGIVLPILVQNIAIGNEAGEKPLVNLEGYFLGNPIVNRHLERNAAIEFAHGMALISDELFKSVQKTCDREYVYVDPDNVECLKDLQHVTECLQDLNLYQILNRNCFPLSKSQLIRKRSRGGNSYIEKLREASISPLPDMEKVSCQVYPDWLGHYYVNNETVQDALHIRRGTVPDWQRCNQCGIKYTRNVVNSFEYYEDLSKRGLRSLIYSGDYDYSIPFMSTQSWIKSLNYSITDDWRPWTVDGQVAGFTRTYANNMTYATVKEQNLQIASNGGECILGAQPAIGCLKDLKEQEDEDELTCMVCKKGYYSKPNDTLGVYSYSKLVKLDPIKKRGVYTTISNFNIIHFQCHQICKQAGNPKKEWKGALIRNHGGLCNSIFPIKSPSVSTLQYVQCVSEYWGNLKRVGRGGGSRLQLLSYDLLLMLGRFSTMKSLKCEETEKDTRLIPFMIQMGRYLVEQERSPRRRIKPKAITSSLQSCSTQPNQLQLLMVTSLLVLSYESWLTIRPAFLECGIELAYMQHKNEQPLFSEPVAAREKFCIKPILVYIGLIEQLQRFFKLDTTSSKVSWDVIMTEKLNNIKELLDFSKKLLVWLEEMMLARKLSRVFEIMDVSSDLDFGKFSKYEEFAEFLKDVIPSVKKGKKRKRKEKKGMQVV